RIDLLASCKLLHRRRFGLQLHRGGGDLNSFTGGSDRELDVDREIGARIEFIAARFVFAETGSFGDDVVQTWRYVGDGVVARVVGGGGTVNAAIVLNGDLDVRDRRTGRIFYETGNRSEVRLREQQPRNGEAQAKNH